MPDNYKGIDFVISPPPKDVKMKKQVLNKNGIKILDSKEYDTMFRKNDDYGDDRKSYTCEWCGDYKSQKPKCNKCEEEY